MLARVMAALALPLSMTGCASSLIHFPNATPGRSLEVSAWEWRPKGPGRYPAIVLLHGCDGVLASTRDWARWFRDQRYVALVVDSWGPRHIRDGCAGGEPDIPNTERFDDAVGALRFLATRPYVDADRVGVIGWSLGGVFAMAVVNGPSLERARARGVVMPGPGFRAAVGVYPGGCFSLIRERVIRPLLILMGDTDDWTTPGPCVEMVDAMRAGGADVSIVLYPGAVHYFDVEGQARTFRSEVGNRNWPGGCCGATVGYDEDAARDARHRVAEFFGYHLGAR